MSDPQPNPPPIPNPPPVPKNNSFDKIKWLLVALIPAVFGIVCLQLKDIGQWWMSALIVLDSFFSIVAGIGLVRQIEKRWLQILLAFILIVGLFVLNAFIVIFIGCTEAVATNGI